MKRFKYILLFGTMSVLCHAQQITLDFPHFRGQEWFMTAFKGESKDTIAVGKLDDAGKVKIILSDKYQDYRGAIQWMLRSGGGIDIILSGRQDVSVSCTEAQPSKETIIYNKDSENNYLSNRYDRQQAIVEKINVMHMAVKLYTTPSDPTAGGEQSGLSGIFGKELAIQEQAYNLLQKETAARPLYGARFAQIVDVTRGLPPTISTDDETNNSAIQDFILRSMDIDVLYTSGHWQGILSQWLDKYIYNPDSEPLLLGDYLILKKRIANREIAEAFEASIQKMLNEKNRGDLALLVQQKAAPALTQGKLNKQCIVAFYDSGCGSCVGQMDELAKQHDEIRKKGYEVISVSADADKHAFEHTVSAYPWKQKLCDFKGFAGPNFINYKVMGTPTFYVIDKGIIKGVYAQIKDIKL